MAKSNQPSPPEHESEPGVIYRRTISKAPDKPAASSDSSPPRHWGQSIAPTLVPLIAGFLLFLILVFMLGLLSLRRMDEVSIAVSNLERQNAAKLSVLLKLRLAVTRLDNEARARASSEARDEIRPPIDMRLSGARDELNELVQQFEHSSLASDPAWQEFQKNLREYSEVTRDLRRYSLEGFEKFNVVDRELNAFLARASEEHDEVERQSRLIEQDAASSIRSWTMIALIFGAIVAAGTIWEVQRRFAQMRQSVSEASRERVFTSQLLEGMVSAVAAIDDNDRIRSANAPFFRIFPGASVGASVYEAFGSREAAKMLEAATATRVDKATYRGRWVAVEAGEREQTFDIYSSPLAIDGARGQILTLVDATEAVEAERGLRRQESLAAVGQATAQVAHEIRNPLGSIRLGVSMLRDSVSDAEGLHTIDLVERGIKHLNKLVVDVAQFSSRKQLDRSSANLHDLIERSLELVADKINEKGTVIEKRFTDQKLVGDWDPDQLRQVLVNVIANAIDASPEHSPVSIATEARTDTGSAESQELGSRRHARVTISDRGKGIEQSAADRIFEPFFSTKKRGTGLGLAIVKQIVEQHSGTVTVESKPDEGTSFFIELPL